MSATYQLEWAEFKTFASQRNQPISYFLGSGYYNLFMADGPIVFTCRILFESPASTNQDDFEINYKPTIDANQTPIGMKIVGQDGIEAAQVTQNTGITEYNKRLFTENISAGRDGLGAFRRVNTKVRSDGLTALATDATVVVESTFGFDQNPDSFFRIIETGSAGCEWTLYIAGTNNDPTSPDRDVPAYNKTLIIQPSEVGDEIALRDRWVQELNADTTFRNTIGCKAQKATDRAVVHIYSENFSASGEFWERPNPGDFNMTIGGSPADGVVVVGFDNLISRSKPVTISRDFDSPHRLGLFGITGNVRVEAKELADIFVGEATNPTYGIDMRQNGSLATPVVFEISASINTDLFIEDLIFDAQGNGLKFGQFLSKNTTLANGVVVEIKSDNVITTFQAIQTTEGFKNKWAALSGSGATFRIDVQAGADEMLAILAFNNPFIIRVAGTFTTDDYIKVFIQDNISTQISRFNFRAKGFEKEP